MKRRNFLQGIAAGAGATALPLPAFAKAAATTTKVIPFHYGWACVYAQMNNGISASDIARVFRISQTEASGLMDRMLMRGVIYPPGLDGRSHPTRAWQPWDKRTAAPTSNTDDRPAKTNHADQNGLHEKLQAVMSHVTDDPSYGWAA